MKTIGHPAAVLAVLSTLHDEDVVRLVRSRMERAHVPHGHLVQVEIETTATDVLLRIRSVDPTLLSSEASSKTIE